MYENHSGSLANNAAGYEVAVNLPASFMYNLAGTAQQDFGTYLSFGCIPYFNQPGGNLAPAYWIYRGSTYPYIQLFDDAIGWFNFWPLANQFSERGMGLPRIASSYANASLATSGFKRSLFLTNPVRFRISNAFFTHADTVLWNGLYFAIADECRLAPSAPAAYIGTGEGGSWSLVGAPNISGTTLVFNTLPSGAPLAGRNRVQLIS